MTSTAPAIRVTGIEKSYDDLHVLRGVDFDVATRQHLRPARLERGRQDHDREDPVHAAALRTPARRPSTATTSRRNPSQVRESISLTGQFAAVDEILVRPREPGARRQAAAPAEPRPGRRRPARPLQPRRGRIAPGVDVLGRHASPARHRDEPRRAARRCSSSTSRPRGSTPRRASTCGRSSRSSPRAGRPSCSPRSTSTRPSSSRTASRSCTRAGSSRTARSPSSSSSCRPPRSSTSRSSPPSRRSSSPSSDPRTKEVQS